MSITLEYVWGFRLADDNLIDSLSYILQSPDIAVLREEEDARPPEFFWSSKHFNGLENGADLWQRAAGLKALFDGAMFLTRGRQYYPIELGALIDFKNNRKAGQFYLDVLGGPFSIDQCSKKLSSSEINGVNENLLVASIFAARSDKSVFNILGILGRQGVTFESLYKLTDIFKFNSLSDAEICTMGGFTNSDLRNFKHTANNFEASGFDSRHGETKLQPPTSPMPLNEAADIILKAGRAFVRQRAKVAIAGLSLL